MNTHHPRDIAIIGSGPAGLQAAMTIARVHRTAALFDSGEYRNAPSGHMHNFAGFDGTAPAKFREIALRQITAYGSIDVRREMVTAVSADENGGYLISTESGQQPVRAVVLATGVRDRLPDIPGIAEFWGSEVAHCPFCHGHEFAGKPVALVGAAAPHIAELMRPVASELIAISHDEALGADWATSLSSRGVRAIDASIRSVQRTDDGLRLQVGNEAEAGTVDVAGMFVVPTMSQSAPFAEQLGLELLESGCVKVNEFGMTSRPGIFAAGDMAHLPTFPMPMASVVTSMAAGQMAGLSAIRTLIAPPTS